jgi:hypothetical protein
LEVGNDFKNAIASVFYDKEITLYDLTIVQDADGSTRQEYIESGDTFLGNARFNNLERIRADYGIAEIIDIAITTQETIQNGAILGYDSKFFEVVKVIPFDSHNLIVGKQCLSASLTSISA